MKSKTEIKVRGYHLDGYNHVNNARYLEFLEEARWQHFDHKENIKSLAEKYAFVVVNININFRHSAVMNDELIINTEVAHIGNTSLKFQQTVTIKESNKTSCDAEITFVLLDKTTMKPIKISDDLKELLSQ